jgi:hypothetical protein
VCLAKITVYESNVGKKAAVFLRRVIAGIDAFWFQASAA